MRDITKEKKRKMRGRRGVTKLILKMTRKEDKEEEDEEKEKYRYRQSPLTG